MAPRRPLTAKEIRKAARATISALQMHDLRSCLFGSAACTLYGMKNRIPEDVDVIVLSEKSTDDIKHLLVSTNKKFFLFRSKRSGILRLRYRLYPGPRGSKPRSCKVDILTPGIISIPRIPAHRIVYVERFPDLPLVPFLALLLLKLRGWEDNRESNKRYKRWKQYRDKKDIDELLALAVEEFDSFLHRRRERWMPRWFLLEARARVCNFVERYPDSTYLWNEIGFDVE